jgi:hypothetical protein
MYSFTYTLTEFLLIKIHKGIKNVVSIIKKSDIPSIPKYISILKKGIQPNF